jgi:hypothetical protein
LVIPLRRLPQSRSGARPILRVPIPFADCTAAGHPTNTDAARPINDPTKCSKSGSKKPRDLCRMKVGSLGLSYNPFHVGCTTRSGDHVKRSGAFRVLVVLGIADARHQYDPRLSSYGLSSGGYQQIPIVPIVECSIAEDQAYVFFSQEFPALSDRGVADHFDVKGQKTLDVSKIFRVRGSNNSSPHVDLLQKANGDRGQQDLESAFPCRTT